MLIYCKIEKIAFLLLLHHLLVPLIMLACCILLALLIMVSVSDFFEWQWISVNVFSVFLLVAQKSTFPSYYLLVWWCPLLVRVYTAICKLDIVQIQLFPLSSVFLQLLLPYLIQWLYTSQRHRWSTLSEHIYPFHIFPLKCI